MSEKSTLAKWCQWSVGEKVSNLIVEHLTSKESVISMLLIVESH